MVAYLLVLFAVLSRLMPHAGWWSFTLVGGALLYFGARRPWKEMLLPLAVLVTTDCYLTVFKYPGFSIRVDSVFTWGWYLAAMVLGAALLGKRVTLGRGVGAALLGPTSFFVVSNFGVWLCGGINMYPHTLAGLASCYLAGVPFYRNDLASTALVLGVMLGVPALVRRMQPAAMAATAGK
jgi:hypothetical protein